jgi:hypothetical protein
VPFGEALRCIAAPVFRVPARDQAGALAGGALATPGSLPDA